MHLFWIFLAITAICAALVVYPYLVYPLVLRLLRSRPVNSARSDLSFSLLFCAFNEADSLPAKLDNLRQLKTRWPDLEILAGDDCSTDGTYEELAGVPDLLTVVRATARAGKAAGMKRLAAMATREILVFTDANVLLAEDALDHLLPYYGDPEVGGVCGTLHYLDDPASVTAQVGSAYWRLDERLRTLESATGNVMGADGSIFSVRKSLYPSFPDTVLDDFTVSMSVVFAGKRLVKAPDVIAFERSVALRGEELRRKVRIGARAYHTHAYLRPQLAGMTLRDKFKYASRKLLRWFGGLFLMLGMAAGFVAVATIGVVPAVGLAGLLLLVAAIAVRRRAGLLARACEILLATLATFVGVLQAMRGRTVVTWAPAQSR